MDAAAEWVGMPDYEHEPEDFGLMIRFESHAERDRMAKEVIGLAETEIRQGVRVWSAYWPPRTRDDVDSLIYADADG